MGFIVKTKPLQTLYRELGIEEKGKVQQFLGKTVANNNPIFWNSNNKQITQQIVLTRYNRLGIGRVGTSGSIYSIVLFTLKSIVKLSFPTRPNWKMTLFVESSI